MTPWASRADLEAAVVTYQRDWWRTNATALSVINDRTKHPGLRAQVLAISSLGQLVTTADVYRPNHPGAPEDRAYLPVRRTVHRHIVEECLPADPALQGADTAHPDVYFTIGCPGAGKTSLLRGIVDLYRSQRSDSTGAPVDSSYAIIDADRVRQLLPEYADGLGAFVVEEECYALTYGEVFDRAVALRADIVYDTIGRLSSIRPNLELLASEGYRIHVLHARSDLDVCRQRTEQRALQVDGRLVNPAMLTRAANDAEEVIGALLAEGFPLSGWARIDTSDFDAPALIEGTAPWTAFL